MESGLGVLVYIAEIIEINATQNQLSAHASVIVRIKYTLFYMMMKYISLESWPFVNRVNDFDCKCQLSSLVKDICVAMITRNPGHEDESPSLTRQVFIII